MWIDIQRSYSSACGHGLDVHTAARASIPWRQPCGICSVPEPAPRDWHSLRCARMTKLSKQLSLLKIPLKHYLCLACGAAESQTEVLKPLIVAGQYCFSGKQVLPPRYDLHTVFILQFLALFHFYFFLIHEIVFEGGTIIWA